MNFENDAGPALQTVSLDDAHRGSLDERLRPSLFSRTQDGIRRILASGLEPRELTLAMIAGAMLGTIPVLGVSTFLCAIVAVAFRLNLATIQLVNYLVYPVQLGLLVPLLLAGAKLTHVTLHVKPSVIMTTIQSDPLAALFTYGQATLGAVLIWFVFAALVSGMAYRPLVASLTSRKHGQKVRP